MKRYMGLLILASGLLAGCGGAATAPATESGPALDPDNPIPVTISLGYIPDVQFAPFYVGIEKGFWKARGLDVTTEHRQETEGAKLVATGDLPFAVVSGEQVLLGREQGLAIVYVFAWYQSYPVGIASKSEQGITSPEALRGHSVGVPVREGASYIGLRAILAAAGLSESDIDLQTTGYAQVETLATDAVDAVVVYVANEPVQLAAQGIVVDLLAVSDYADLVSNGIITSEAMIAEHPDQVRALVEGFAEALQYTIDHPDEAFEISKGFVEGLGDPDNEAAQREVLARSIELWTGETAGQTNAGSWAAMQALLIDMGLLAGEQELEAAFSNEFVP